jgi:GNAT superfamily N-acetyltransferase
VSAPLGDDLRRLEELCLNSSATPRQLLYDGWLVRLAPGKAKRARSINPFYPSSGDLDAKLARCAELYRAAELPLLVRITPFVHPADLDAALAARGFALFEETRVMTADIGDGEGDAGVEPCDLDTLVAAVGALRGSPERDRASHRQRLGELPLPVQGFAIRDGDAIVCAGVVIAELPWVGLFDVVTAPAHRGRGLASRLTRGMLAWARGAGATHAYLQVDATNAPARAVYGNHGFVDRYAYWYRVAPATP